MQEIKFYVGYRVTERCNAGQQCISRCFSRQGTPQKDPTLDEIRRTLSNVAPFAHTVNSMGGEPTIRPDLPEILHMAQQEGVQRVLSTNGLLLHPGKYPGRLEEIVGNLDWMSLSFDSADSVKNDWMRGKGQHDAAHAIIQWFFKNRPDCKLKINTQVTRQNMKEILEIPQVFGFDVVTDWKLLQWTGRGDARKVTDTWSITPDQFTWLVSEVRTSYPNMTIVERAWPEPDPDTLIIRPDGMLQINSLEHDYVPVGNVLTGDPRAAFTKARILYERISQANNTEFQESYPAEGNRLLE